MPEITIPEFEEVSVGGQRLDPGKYTFVVSEKPQVKDLDMSAPLSDQKPYLEVVFKVIDGPPQEEANSSGTNNPAGMLHTQRFYLNAKWGVKRLLISTGLLARDDTESPMAKGKFNTDMLYNCKLDGVVKTEMYNGREYRNVEPII
jgi:hypothetical protein